MKNRVCAILAAPFIASFVFLVEQTAWAADGAATAPVAAATPQQGIYGMIVPFAAMFAVIYFLMIRPQQKKMKDQQELISKIKPGDEVLTASGILGKVSEVSDKIVMLEVAEKVRIKMLKSQISQVVHGS